MIDSITIQPPSTNCGQVCEQILRALPEWFGIEESLIQYVKDADSMPTMLVKDGNDITLYRDGASVGTSSGSGNFETGGSNSIVDFPITIGAGWDNGNATYYADGYIDQFRVSNTARWTGNFST